MKNLKPMTLFVAWLAFGIGMAQVELEPGQHYQGGMRVQSSGLGISFALPAGWLGAYKQEGDQAVMGLGSNTLEGVGLVIFVKKQAPAQVVQALSDAQDLGEGVVLNLVGKVQTQGSRVTARYANQQHVGRALALLGTGKNHIIYFYAGPHKNERLYGQLLEALASSTRFQPPLQARPQTPAPTPTGLAKQWTQFLGGMMLKYFSSYNAGGGGGISDERTLHFCLDGSFAYSSSSLTTMNVPGATASTGGTGRASGSWRVESADQNSAVLVLSMDGGGVERPRVEYDGQKTFLNGDRWFRVESDACR